MRLLPMRRLRSTALSAVLVSAVASPSLAQEKKPDFPPFAEVTKDMKVKEGFFTLYHDEKKDRLLARVPKDVLKKPFLLASSISHGPVYAGWQWGDAPVYFERLGKQLVLMVADPRYKKGEKSEVADVIARTYTDSIITAVPILTETEGDPVIDLAALFKTTLGAAQSLTIGTVDRGLSRFSKVRNFADNMLIGVDLAVRNRFGLGSSDRQKFRIIYSLSRLPENNGYEQRAADDRIGYFMVAFKDWTTDHKARTIFTRSINRWRLRKAEPKEKVSDVRPEDQIVYYIEKTVPVKYRRYVREGILEWNKAFEAAGLRNAIVVHQQTETVHADKDPEDIRYNFFRWIVSGSPFAMGPSRANPFTGEILDADIIFDDSYIRYWINEYDVLGPRATASVSDAPVSEFLTRYPEWKPGPRSFAPVTPEQPDPIEAYRKTLKGGSGGYRDQRICEIGLGAARQLAFSALQVAQASEGEAELPEEFIGQALKETVMHEVGHTLGLRHNFKASSWLDLETIKKGGEEGSRRVTGSVMDYNPYVYAGKPEDQKVFATATLGPYDYWAIEYGYRHFMADEKDEEAPKNEKEMLRAIASRCAEAGLAFATDEDSSSLYPDPSVNPWDNGDDPLAFARDRMETAQRLWKDGLDWAVKDGASRDKARRVFGILLAEYGFAGRIAARMVGGQYLNRDHKGDPGGRAPIQIVPVAEQREALEFLEETVLSAKAFEFTPELLNSLAPGRWSHWESDALDFQMDYDVHARVLAIQSGVLFQLMNPFTVNRVYDAELKIPADQDALTVVELFDTMTHAIWSELNEAAAAGGNYTDRTPLINSFRRSLQREHLGRLIRVLLEEPGWTLNADAHAVVRMTLKKLVVSVGEKLTQTKDRLDDFTRAHLVDAQRRINNALEAEFTAPESRRTSFFDFIFLIGQEADKKSDR